MIHLIRIAFLVVILAMCTTFALTENVVQMYGEKAALFVIIPAAAGVGIILLDMFWRRKRLQVLSGLFFGLLAGLVIAYILGLVVDLAATYITIHPEGNTVRLIKFLLGAVAVFLCVTIVLQTRDDFRFVIPYVEFAKETKGARPLLLDTSVIIDGRISDICQTRILDSQLLVPRFILRELQMIADSDDKLKRNRGRRGLDVLNNLQKSGKVDIRILDSQTAGEEQDVEVDAKLVSLAQRLGARIITNDYNLNKISQLRGVEVININDLANALKPIVLPGEAMKVKILKPGAEAGQGVGYLEDGTMVVVEQGREYQGQEVTISVTSALQTSAGRMIFGRLEDSKASAAPRSGRGAGPARP